VDLDAVVAEEREVEQRVVGLERRCTVATLL
jgi:hypothetical protein